MRNATITKIPTTTGVEKSTNLKNFALDGRSFLLAEEATTTKEVTRVVNARNKSDDILKEKTLNTSNAKVSFPLKEITAEELKQIRKSDTPSFVLKEYGKYYYAQIPKEMSLYSSLLFGTHQCATTGKECRFLSAASDENGGCAKVREGCKGIEKYPWITVGYETFNTQRDCFIVSECDHYKPCVPKKKPSKRSAK